MKHDLEPVGAPVVVSVLRRWGGEVLPVRWHYRCRTCGRKFTSRLLAGEPYDAQLLDDCQGQAESS